MKVATILEEVGSTGSIPDPATLDELPSIVDEVTGIAERIDSEEESVKVQELADSITLLNESFLNDDMVAANDVAKTTLMPAIEAIGPLCPKP